MNVPDSETVVLTKQELIDLEDCIEMALDMVDDKSQQYMRYLVMYHDIKKINEAIMDEEIIANRKAMELRERYER